MSARPASPTDDEGLSKATPVDAPITFPEFGQPTPVLGDAPTLRFLARRRSASAVTLEAPGPSAQEVELLLKLAVRVPDHGKLTPWRFVIWDHRAKISVGGRLSALAAQRKDGDRLDAKLAKFVNPPLTIAVTSCPVQGHPVPEWEQILSAGAVCQQLLIAAGALGFGANWITDWYAYDEEARTILGLADDEKVAGFIHIGTPSETPLERPRPNPSDLARYVR